MTILLAPDKFKGSLSAKGVCDGLAKGIKAFSAGSKILKKPMADGGDGSLAVLGYYLELETITLEVQAPLGRSISASYKKQDDKAYIELAAASGLVLLKPEERNCLLTSTFGTGQLIKDAIQNGAKTIYLFIGGSATNDGGVGIAQALGYRFYDENRQQLAPIGENLIRINRIDSQDVFFDSNQVNIKVISDVNNPFYGKNGAAHVYAMQKGASKEDIELLDEGLKSLAHQLISHGFQDMSTVAGSGAAGGVGGGAMSFLGAELMSGIQFFLELTDLESAIQACDVVVTGEGKLDQQSLQGKVISGVYEQAKYHQKPIIIVCGDADRAVAATLDIQQSYTVLEESDSLADAMEQTATKLYEIGLKIGDLLKNK
ncbi:MAG: glycerate kinase [Bacteroidota bacterium]